MAPRLPAAERRTQLLRAALDVFARAGYHGASMNEVAVAAGVTKPVLYQHFSSKEALYLEVLRDVGAALDGAIDDAVAASERPRDKVVAGLTAYFTFVRDHRPAFRLLFGSGAQNDRELGGAVRDVTWTIADHIADMLRDVAPPEVATRLAHGVVGMAEGTCRHWLAREPEVEPAALAADMASLVWDGLRHLAAQRA